MKIIKNGKYPEYPLELKCGSYGGCNSILEVETNDVCSRPYQIYNTVTQEYEDWYGCSDYYRYINCPVCGCEIEVRLNNESL